MKHIEVINKIIDAEQKAQQLAEQARDEQLHLDENLKESTDTMRESYMNQARERISTVRHREEQQTAEKIKALATVHSLEMEEMEGLYREHREAWIDEIFQKILAR